MKTVILMLGLLLASAGCQQQTTNANEEEGSTQTLWVAKSFSGGRQCEDDGYQPPDTRKLLEAHQITVLATATKPLPVCLACHICPAYAARHLAQIPASQLTAAESLGFQQHKPPPSELPGE